MVYCVQAYLIFADTATRDQRLAQATSAATQNKPRWDVTNVQPVSATELLIDVRYISKDDQLNVEDALRKLGGLQPGSYVQYHDCTHDEGSNRCTGLVRTEV